jgi:hypothetical protein
MPLFWLSFVDPQKPSGEQFTGVALVEAEGDTHEEALKHAIRRAWATGCNPGGEIQSVLLDGEVLDRMPNENRVRLVRAPRDTLLSKDELAHLDLI